MLARTRVESPNGSLETRALLFHGFSDRSRLSIVEALRDGERRVSDVVAETGLTQPNVSMHLACLWDCGLVAREKRGREVYYRLIEGVPELLAAADTILAVAGETVGAGPRYGTGRRVA
jgi:DNA-binding transcriptional ArsR family regulator